MEAGEEYLSHMGQYPVIFLTLKSAKQPNYKLAYEVLLWDIRREFTRHRYVLQDDILTDEQRRQFERILADDVAEADCAVAFKILSECLYAYHKKNVIILLDEYDVPLENAYFSGFYDEMVGFIRSLFEGINVYLTLAIPNMEILYIYENSIKDWFREQVKVTDFSKMYEAVLSGDARTFQENIVAQLRRSISYYDTVEQFYHGFMLGILSPLKDYRVLSNRKGGNGRTDITLTPVDLKMPAVILEFKCAKKLTELEAGCDEALKQIDDRNYMDEPVEEGCTHIIKYGICFYKKICKVKCKEETVEFLY